MITVETQTHEILEIEYIFEILTNDVRTAIQQYGTTVHTATTTSSDLDSSISGASC